jgi:hypothetical protein
MSVELDFNANDRRGEHAERERAMLECAQAGDDVAAATLLSFYSRFGKMNAPEVQVVIE